MLHTERLHALAGARLYLCTDSRRRQNDLADFLDAVLPAGVDIVQLREKGLEAAEELELLQIITAATQRHGRLLAVNDRADVAALAGAAILHGGQRDLTPSAARGLLGPDVLLGRSSHTPEQFDAAAADPHLDYTCVGPTWPTPTKPGRPATGLNLVRHAAANPTNRPWFAIGGIDLTTINTVVEAGAQRVVVVPAITQADDPTATTTALLQHLPPLTNTPEPGNLAMKPPSPTTSPPSG